ncbi:MAG: GDP-mannose mannosyl hydrolase [Methylophilaceae bacterium]
MLNYNTFLKVVESTPLVSVDLLLMRGNEVLLGLRNNRPARSFWFVPGGRILKNETIVNALQRIADKELGLASFIESGQLVLTFYGTYEHFYDDSFAGEVGISTHYVVLAHKVLVPADFALTTHDEQHAELKWWSIHQLLHSKKVHQYTKNYFSQG